MNIEEKCVIGIDGKEIDVNKVKNPKLKRVLAERMQIDEVYGFLHKPKHKNCWSEQKDSSKYSDHKDWMEYGDKSQPFYFDLKL